MCQTLFSSHLNRAKQLITDAILDNDFTKNFDVAQSKEIVDCMYPKHFDAGQIIIREGDAGAEFYVAAGKIDLQCDVKKPKKLVPCVVETTRTLPAFGVSQVTPGWPLTPQHM